MKVFFKMKPSIYGEWVTDKNAKAEPPTIVRDSKFVMDMIFFDSNGGNLVDLSKYSKFMFVIGDDYDTDTPVKLTVDSDKIQQGVYTKSDGTVHNSLLSIQMQTTDSALKEALGTKQKVQLMFEVTGFQAGCSAAGFVAQGDIIVRNRISLTTPSIQNKRALALCGEGVCGEMVLGKEG